jgi:hypothetical protein
MTALVMCGHNQDSAGEAMPKQRSEKENAVGKGSKSGKKASVLLTVVGVGRGNDIALSDELSRRLRTILSAMPAAVQKRSDRAVRAAPVVVLTIDESTFSLFSDGEVVTTRKRGGREEEAIFEGQLFAKMRERLAEIQSTGRDPRSAQATFVKELEKEWRAWDRDASGRHKTM